MEWKNPKVDPEDREVLAAALAWGQQRTRDAVFIAQSMLTKGKHMYRDSVPYEEKLRRRRRGKAAKAARKRNRS